MSRPIDLLNEALTEFEAATGAIRSAMYVEDNDPSGDIIARYAREAMEHAERASDLITQANLAAGKARAGR